MPLLNENQLDDYLDYRLQEWAEWLNTGNFLNIGYQRESSIAMFMDGKSINRNSRFFKTVDTNESAQEMEKLVTEMARYKPAMANALRMYYLERLSFRESAKKLKISYTQYNMYVQTAKSWLAGKICTL
ncbi:MAG: antiterminator Q family protein [Gammaproteobacteria bacterium]|nr:antiterminator Q family protein [Gammaproteobacteria bacterium]